MILTNTQDFVLLLDSKITDKACNTTKRLNFETSVKHALFLKSELKLEMFVPCDEDGSVLEEPIISEHLLDRFSQQPVKSENTPEAYRYRKAKKRVLFKGFENHKIEDFKKYLKITNNELRTNGVFSRVEHLVNNVVVYPIELTEAGIKQFM